MPPIAIAAARVAARAMKIRRVRSIVVSAVNARSCDCAPRAGAQRPINDRGVTLWLRAACAVTRAQFQYLHLLRKLDQKLFVAVQMVDPSRIAVREAAHRLQAFPIRDRHELGLVLAVLAERLDSERLVQKRFDAGFVVVSLVLVCQAARGAAAPDADNRRCLGRQSVHETLLQIQPESAASHVPHESGLTFPLDAFAQRAMIACNASSPSVSAAGPGCRIKGDLTSCNCASRTAGITFHPARAATFSARNFLPHHEPMMRSGARAMT